MALYAIGDFHLSFGSDKPMDIFGKSWDNHVEKIRAGFLPLKADDVCVICGDLSWALNLEGAREDFRFIDSLPGKKIILKGNHDYWWSTAAKAKAMFADCGITTIAILHNNCFFYGENAAICGTRGWFYEIDSGSAHDRKILLREVGRLETSLKAAGSRDKYVFLHYPPKYRDYECPEILALLEKYAVRVCCAGHIHGAGLRQCFEGILNGTEHFMVSGDYLGFKPKKILS
ncbi:MAG: metallophosphoesterase [Oscillospiraceae bacterium]